MIAARLIPVVWVVIIVFYPVSYPISALLDRAFGHDERASTISRDELEALMILQNPQHRRAFGRSIESGTPVTITPAISGRSSPQSAYQFDDENEDIAESVGKTEGLTMTEVSICALHEPCLTSGQVSILSGVMKLSQLKVEDCMIPLEKVFMISADLKLDDW
jgi:CBS domain containing-hemolysin-like protein